MSLSLHDEDEVFVPAEVLVSQHALHTDDTNLTGERCQVRSPGLHILGSSRHFVGAMTWL